MHSSCLNRGKESSHIRIQNHILSSLSVWYDGDQSNPIRPRVTLIYSLVNVICMDNVFPREGINSSVIMPSSCCAVVETHSLYKVMSVHNQSPIYLFDVSRAFIADASRLVKRRLLLPYTWSHPGFHVFMPGHYSMLSLGQQL